MKGEPFDEKMARLGYDPKKRYPEIQPPPMPVYLGKGEWAAPQASDDDKGWDDDSEFFADLLDGDPPVDGGTPG